jgi:hypothetical protein
MPKLCVLRKEVMEQSFKIILVLQSVKGAVIPSFVTNKVLVIVQILLTFANQFWQSLLIKEILKTPLNKYRL